MKIRSIALAWLCVFSSGAAAAATPNWNALVDSYFNEWFKFNPTAATMAGFHDHDSELEDYSAEQVNKESKWLHESERRIEAFPAAQLKPDEAIDREVLLNSVRAQLLEYEKIRFWRKNPDRYGSEVANGIFPVMSRKFASPQDRLRSVISREKQIPAVFDAGRKNLTDPSKVLTEIALEQLEGTVSFFKDDVPGAFKEVLSSKSPKDVELAGEFKKSNDAVLAGIAKYVDYLKKQVLPRARGDFRLGAQNYALKLKYEEMFDLPLDQLLKVGLDNLRANQEMFKQVAASIDPNRTPQAILEELVHDHPTADKMLDAFQDRVIQARTYIEDHQIATIPSTVPPIIEETPAFERALFFASLDPPGPYETHATEAYLNVTLPEPNWPKQRVEEHLEGYNRGTIVSTSVHEAYPGHYLQFLWLPKVTSKVRRLIGANSNIEGWAHYCEEMMLEQGFGKHDPKLKLGQLQDALLRNARFIVGIRMHAGKKGTSIEPMTYEQGIDFFVKEGYQSRANGEREVKRGTSDPTYLYYTAGKLGILKLRDDYRKLKGKSYSLRDFHDQFLQQGPLPIKLMRRAMLGSDGEVF